MKKYAIVVDSSCGLTKAQAEKLGWYYLPLYIDIDGTNYADGVEIDSSNIFDKFTLKSNVKTSMFNLSYAEELFTKLSAEYEEIIVYPISKALSNSFSALSVMKADFPKLKIIESVEIATLILIDLFWFQSQMELDSSKINEYINFMEQGSFKKSITLIPKHNKYLVKGGRLHPAAALIAKMFNIVPMIKFENGQLLKEGIGRNFYKTILKNAQQKANDFRVDENHVKKCIILHSGSTDEDLVQYKKQVEKLFNVESNIYSIPPVVSIHVGPEAYVLIVTSLPKELSEVVDKQMNIIFGK
ncbi:DegV family protein [Mycoplasmopsis felifaucium]|uniref:DegV family protein n=1 Tax=Mycoplasmopsis felifaucium TaxID=35768 RepID=UPI000481948E|nr:DegV family protein [Mycoplasmopsis felifaucium]